MIQGVVIKTLKVHKDKPDLAQPGIMSGVLMEILRSDDDFFKKFGQSTMTISYPGTIKGFHWHEQQDDLWFVASGRATIVLHDLRADSPTLKETAVLNAGEGDYKLVVIPAGVAHGYKVTSAEPLMLFYHTTEPYNASAPDERRIPHDSPEIGFDWKKI